MIRRDLPKVLRIDQQASDNPWSKERFISNLRQRSIIGMVAEIQGDIAAYMIYQLEKPRLQLIRIAVASDYQNMGIGTECIDKLKSKLSIYRRHSLRIMLDEYNVRAACWLRNRGFATKQIVKDEFGKHRDGYLFEYTLCHEPEVVP